MVELRDLIELPARERDRRIDSMVPLRSRSLHASAALRPVSPDVLDVDSGRDDFNIVQRKLAALSDDVTIDSYHSASIVVQPVAVAALLIGIEVNAAELDLR